MIRQYLDAAMRKAKYEMLPDNGSYYGEIPGFQGVWADAETLEDCRNELEEVLEEWVLFRVSKDLSVPALDGAELKFKEELV